MIAPQYQYLARSVRVVDGDTVVLEVDHGMQIHSTQMVRIAGVDTHELRGGTEETRQLALEAKLFVQEWMADAIVAAGHDPWPLRIHTHKDSRSFNRYIADIFDANGVSLAGALLEAGHFVQ